MLEIILLQLTDLYNMTCVYCRAKETKQNKTSKQLLVVFKKGNEAFAFALEHV